MGLWDSIRGEFIDIIEWLDDSRDTMVHRFERHDNEIKNGAKLVVRESQRALFVSEGRLADAFGPGTYTLETENLPILSTLLGWKYGFDSPFKAEVYFVSTRIFPELKWGTKHPITMRDPEFGPVRVRVFGTYSIRVADAAKFLREVVGTDGVFRTDEISDQIRDLIVAQFADVLGERRIPILDVAANYRELGDLLSQDIQRDLDDYGLGLSKLRVENVSLPPEVEKVLDERTSLGVIGDLSRYTQWKTATAMGDAAKNPGMAGGGMAMGMGFAMANQMGEAARGASGGSGASPPPLPGAAAFHVALDGQSAGPFDPQALRRLASEGRLTPATLVWRAGLPDWRPARDVPEVAALFPEAPPPLPS